MTQQELLKESVKRFYDDYHQQRSITPNKWMQQVYWPACVGSTLELGGGTKVAQRRDYVAVDISIEAMRRSYAQGIPSITADGGQLPFGDNAFDTVACYAVVEHVVELPLFLKEMCRVARYQVIIAAPNSIGKHPGGMSRYLPLRLWSLISGQGNQWIPIPDPYLTFDEHWQPDRDAVAYINAGWVADQLRQHGLRIRHLRTWEYGSYTWLNHFPALRCLGPWLFVVGQTRKFRQNA